MNLPNKITLSRIALIPVVLVLFLVQFPYHYIAAALLFGVAASTDFIDGNIARKRNLVTNLGKVLDPIADKILVVAGLFLIVMAKVLPEPFMTISCIIIMSRELIIGALRQIAAAANVVLAADRWGKMKTTATDIAIPFLFAAVPTNNEAYSDVFLWIGGISFIIAVVLTIFSGINYIVKNKNVFAEKKIITENISDSSENGTTTNSVEKNEENK